MDPENQTSTSPDISKEGTDYVQHDAPVRQSHLCCGFCCDLRTAAITVNCISLGFAALGLVTLAPQMDRPAFERFGLLISAFIIGILCNALGLYGALKFKKSFVMVAAVWYGIEAILSIVLFLDFIGAAVALCFLYPHVMLFKALKDGTMSKERFPIEKDCCGSCC